MTAFKIIWLSILSIPEFVRPENSLWQTDELKGVKPLRFVLAPVVLLIAIFAVLVVTSRRNTSGSVHPPLNAAFLLYLFYDAKNCDALVGDLEERYRIIRKRFGARRANFWYWTQVIRSVGPIAWAATKKLLKAASGVAAALEIWRRIRG